MSLRAFLAIDLDPALRDVLARFQDECRRALPTLNWVPPESLHVTIKFLGHIPETDVEAIREALRDTLKTLTPFSLVVEGIGAFPSLAAPRALWAGITGQVDSLLSLVSMVEQTLEPFGYPPEAKPFRAHLTLARIKSRNRDARAIGEMIAKMEWIRTPPRFGELHVDRLCLFKSELHPSGAVYHRLWDLPLGAQADT